MDNDKITGKILITPFLKLDVYITESPISNSDKPMDKAIIKQAGAKVMNKTHNNIAIAPTKYTFLNGLWNLQQQYRPKMKFISKMTRE